MRKEELEAKGFKMDIEGDGVIVNFVKEINEDVELVLTIAPMNELFIYLKEDEIRIVLDTDDLDLAEKLASIIVEID
jgi:hypothetical protein